MSPGATQKQITEQAQAVATLAEAIAEGKIAGPYYGAVKRLKYMVDMLEAWVGDDRFDGSEPIHAGDRVRIIDAGGLSEFNGSHGLVSIVTGGEKFYVKVDNPVFMGTRKVPMDEAWFERSAIIKED